MTQPYQPSDAHEVTLSSAGEAGMLSPENPPAAGIYGPWNVAGFLFFFADRDQWAQPGFNLFTIDLQGLDLGAQTVTADVTELIPPAQPHIGDAMFETKGVMFDALNQFVSVEFFLDWGSPLPVAIMMNIGFTAAFL